MKTTRRRACTALLAALLPAARAQDSAAAPDLVAALRALAAARRDGRPEALAAAHDALARQLERRGDASAAIWFGKQALDTPDGAARAERLRRVAGWLAAADRGDEAALLFDRLREQDFAAFAEGRPELLMDLPAPEPTAGEQRFAERWRALDERPRARSAAIDPWLDAALSLLAVPGAVEAPPRARALPRRVRLLQVRAFVLPDHVAWLFGDGAALRVELTEVPQARLEAAVEAAWRALSRPGADPAPLHALWPWLGAPVERAAREAGAERLLMQLDGCLRQVPFAALADGGPPLGERWPVALQRPAAVHARPAAAPALLQALGTTQGAGSLKALPGVAREVCAIVAGPLHGLPSAPPPCARPGLGQGVVAGSGWLDAEFTAERLATVAAQARGGGRHWLHIGTHFVLRPGRVSRSWLLAGDGRPLHLDRLAEIDFSGWELVTLSACDSAAEAVGDDGAAEGLQTLVLRRGARAVLASLWPVGDDSGPLLVTTFYRQMAQTGGDPALALQRAQAAVRARRDRGWDRPYHWAGFQLLTAPDEPAPAAVPAARPRT